MSDRSDDPSASELRLQLRRPPILILFSWFLIATGALAPYALIHIDDLPRLLREVGIEPTASPGGPP